MFIGREKELRQLQEALTHDGAVVMVYGKWRVGKTTLIREALESVPGSVVYYECIKGRMSDNLEGFIQELVRTGVLPVRVGFSTFSDAFAYLNTQVHGLTVVIDEYPYLKETSTPNIVDSLFQSIIDNHTGSLRLILAGSHIGIMKDLLTEGNALYGRFSLVIRLRELNYREAAFFYPERTPYEKAAFYGVFGGSPFINKALDPALSLRENIIRTVLDPSSAVYLYASRLFLSDFSVRMNIERLFAVLGNGRKRYSEIEERLDMRKTGSLSKQLKMLTDMEIVHRNTPVNRPDDAKKSAFEINDNLLRFYFTFVYRNGSALQMLGAEAFYDAYVGPALTEFVSMRFEEICRDFFALQVRSGNIKQIRNIGTFYYDDPQSKKNGEFDIALETADGYAIYEAKYLKRPMKLDEIHREIGQIRDIRNLDVRQIGFIAMSGFAEKADGCVYYEGKDLFTA